MPQLAPQAWCKGQAYHVCIQCDSRSSALSSAWLITSVAGTAAGMLSEVRETLLWNIQRRVACLTNLLHLLLAKLYCLRTPVNLRSSVACCWLYSIYSTF